MCIPEWFIGNNSLELCENLEYLGGFIANSCGSCNLLIKCIVGLNPRHRSTPLLQSLNVHNILDILILVQYHYCIIF